jgi:hypothetical protein
MMSNQKSSTAKFDKVQAQEQFEIYKETGVGKIPRVSENKLGYSEAYAEGWSRIFGKEEDSDSQESNPDSEK